MLRDEELLRSIFHDNKGRYSKNNPTFQEVFLSQNEPNHMI